MKNLFFLVALATMFVLTNCKSEKESKLKFDSRYDFYYELPSKGKYKDSVEYYFVINNSTPELNLILVDKNEKKVTPDQRVLYRSMSFSLSESYPLATIGWYFLGKIYDENFVPAKPLSQWESKEYFQIYSQAVIFFRWKASQKKSIEKEEIFESFKIYPLLPEKKYPLSFEDKIPSYLNPDQSEIISELIRNYFVEIRPNAYLIKENKLNKKGYSKGGQLTISLSKNGFEVYNRLGPNPLKWYSLKIEEGYCTEMNYLLPNKKEESLKKRIDSFKETLFLISLEIKIKNNSPKFL